MALALGILVAWLVLTGPIERWSTYLLWVHMVQHVVLTLLVAPLIVGAAPILPLWRGLPATWSRFLLPFIVSQGLRRVMRVLLHPLTALGAYTLSTWLWHAPLLYDLAAQDPRWHAVEHATFLVGAVLLWIQVLEPTPLRSPWSPLARVAVVLAADLQNTAFCALLAFRADSLYPLYEAGSAAVGMPPLEDQRFAAGVMWIASQVVLLPAAGLLVRKAFRDGRLQRNRERARTGIGWMGSRRPILEWFARPKVRSRARWIVALLAVSVVVEGLIGPRSAALNVATTWSWNVWRGCAIVAIVLVGNLPCVVCPFLAPRALMRRFIRPRWEWPRALRRKWLAVALLALWLVVAEWNAWWANPVATAWVIVGYFASVLLIDALFKGSSFCAWICPLGQYQQSAALASLGATPATVMLTIRGTAAPAVAHSRIDRGVLWMVVTAGGFVTAALMTAPAVGWLDGLADESRSPGAVLACAMVAGMVVIPGVAGLLAAGMERSSMERRFCLGWRALLPCGVAMWVAHLVFHLVTGWGAAWVSLESVIGWSEVGPGVASSGPSGMEMMWHSSVEWLVPAQLIVVQLGVFASIGEVRRTLRDGGVGWIALAVLLGALGCWIVLQPMAMRGVMS